MMDYRNAYKSHEISRLNSRPKADTDLEQTAYQFDRTTLQGLERSALQDRVDIKYVLPIERALDLLRQIQPEYYILDIKGIRVHQYRNIYFDYPDFYLYLQHHNQKLNRYKIRMRNYVGENLTKLEIKFKNNKGRTIKNWKKIEDLDSALLQAELPFIQFNSRVNGNQLVPKVWNRFNRITFGSKAKKERITLDLNLQFFNASKYINIENIAVLEIKLPRRSCESIAVNILKEWYVRPIRFSKYCAGVNLLNPIVKKNRFKKRNMVLSRFATGGVR